MSLEKFKKLPTQEIKSDYLRNILENNDARTQELWRLLEVTERYVDDNFWKKDPLDTNNSNFSSKLWEMVIIDYFLRRGANVVPTAQRKNTKQGNPDLEIILGDNRKLFVECATATKGESPEDFYEDGYSGSYSEFLRPKLVRLSNSIDFKNKKLKGYLKNEVVRSNDIVIFAINSVGYTDTSASATLNKFLYQQGDMTLTMDRNTGKFIDSYFQHDPNFLKFNKENDSTELQNGFFVNNNDRPQNLIGVLYTGFFPLGTQPASSFYVGFDNQYTEYANLIGSFFSDYNYIQKIDSSGVELKEIRSKN